MTKNPNTAAILSVIYPGLGLIYAGKILLGIITTAYTTLFMIILIFFILLQPYHGLTEIEFIFWTSIIIYWVLIVIGSYKSVKINNLEEKEVKVGIVDQDSIICPECLQYNKKGTERCVNCGKNLKLVLLYFGESSFNDIEITPTKIIEYQKNFQGKRNGKTTEYLIKNIQNYDLLNMASYPRLLSYIYSSASSFLILSFEYDFQNGHIARKEVIISKEKTVNLKKLFESKKIPHQEFI